MSTVAPLDNPEADPRVKAVFDDIRATRKTDFINNMWRYLAFDPALLEQTWAEVKRIMATPSSLDPLAKELVYSRRPSSTAAATACTRTPRRPRPRA